MRLTVAILTLNEEKMIERAIASAACADEILIVDGGSTDATVRIASLAGARVVERPFDDFARQRNFALEQAQGAWVFFLDADERITPELGDELRAIAGAAEGADVRGGAGPADAFAVPRRNMALGRWIDWAPGGVADTPVRLLRRGTVRYSGVVHEQIEGARALDMLRNPIVHLTHRSVGALLAKIDQYSDLEADDARRKGATEPPAIRTILASYPKTLWQLWRSGLRKEGIEGAIEASLLAFNRTLVLAKVWERTRAESLDDAYERAERELEAARHTASHRASH